MQSVFGTSNRWPTNYIDESDITADNLILLVIRNDQQPNGYILFSLSN